MSFVNIKDKNNKILCVPYQAFKDSFEPNGFEIIKTENDKKVVTEDIKKENVDNKDNKTEITLEEAKSYVIDFGRHKGEKLEEIENSYLNYLIKSSKEELVKQYCELVLESRK